ncbi:MAG: sigma-70 family RNA polymerase sigma factor [Clostridia bacterium]|nr:sigma-70 family RNA polymerase sigma factor [Clostridia bacterium]
MKKRDLLNFFDDDLLDKLFGFCYARTNDSYEAEELCSDIVYALVKAAHSDGEIENIYPFIWRVARNVYADFSNNRRKRAETICEGDSEKILLEFADEEYSDDTTELLTSVYRRMAFLTKTYREVMISFYIEGLSTKQIAKKQGISEVGVRQRLFSARQKIKSEVEEMAETYNKPVALDKINFVFWGTGSPAWGDPSTVCYRSLSCHIVWLCRKKPMSASEIAEELNVPTLYVEEELEILRKGKNGEYGLLRRMDNGKYAINIVLLDKEVFEKANEIYMEMLPKICDTIYEYIEKHKTEYLAYPYLNKTVNMNLILWQQICEISKAFSETVKRILKEKHFSDVAEVERPYSSFGYVDNGKYYGGGCDGEYAENVCGFSKVHLRNIYITRVKAHFRCGHNISRDPQIQLALRAIEGLDITTLSEKEKEHAAKAIECGYLYRDGDVLYTKILVNKLTDNYTLMEKDLFKISNGLRDGYFDTDAEIVAERVAKLIKKSLPDHLLAEWRFANILGNAPVLDAVVECLIEKGVLTPPEDGIGAEGCWMSVEK